MALPVAGEGLPEERKLLTGIETPKALLGLKHACSRPPQHHPAVSPRRVAYSQLQRLDSEFAVAFIIKADIDARHEQRTVINLIGQCAFQQSLDLHIFHHTALHGGKIFFLFHHVPVHNLFQFFFRIRSSQMRVARPLPSRKGWAIFISTYFSMTGSNVLAAWRRYD